MLRTKSKITTSVTRRNTSLLESMDYRHYSILLILVLSVVAVHQVIQNNAEAKLIEEQNLIQKYAVQNSELK